MKMKKIIGIIGGMTPESTTLYYEHIIHTYEKRYGDYAFPEVLIYSVSFQDYVDWMNQEKWESIAGGLTQAVLMLENAGADFIVIATNTMHLLFDKLQSRIQMPLISIIDAVAESIKAAGFKKVGLLGTEFTMNHPFYKQVYLRMMPIEGGEPGILAYLYGGQGTINVPSWSPDSKQVAFISNTKVE